MNPACFHLKSAIACPLHHTLPEFLFIGGALLVAAAAVVWILVLTNSR